MDLINNRYRVLKNLNQDQLVSSYLVSDIIEKQKIMRLNIINSEYLPESLLLYYINEYSSLINMKIINLSKVYDIGVVDFIDNKKINNVRYFYTYDNIDSNLSFFDLVFQLNPSEILSLFCEICKIVNTLHLKNKYYEDINLNNIYFTKSEAGVIPTLKDMASIKLEKHNYWSKNSPQLLFNAPEVVNGGKSSAKSDIYSLGILFLMLDNKSSYESFNKNKALSHFQNTYGNELYEVISRMVDIMPSSRPSDLTEIISKISCIFNKNYLPFYKENLEILDLDIKLIDRDYELNKINEIYSTMNQPDGSSKLLFIHGDSGIGKSKLLVEFQRLQKFKNNSVYYSFSLNDSNLGNYNPFVEILKRLIAESDNATLEPYESELIKLIPDIGDNKYITPSEPLSGDKEKYRLMNVIYNFIINFVKDDPTTIIIDNIHLANDFTIELLDYFHMRNFSGKKILMLLSYNDRNYKNNKKLCAFLKKLKLDKCKYDVPLHGLSSTGTCTMIKGILNYSSDPINFSNRIYMQTDGNPLFIVETIKDFYYKKIITVDSNTGYWVTSYDDNYDELPIPETLEQAVLNQIKEIDDFSYDIISTISIFKTAVPIDVINCFLSVDNMKLETRISNLVSKGILCRKIDDRGFVYDFNNKLLKDITYNKLPDENRMCKHKLASEILEKQNGEDRSNNEEIIYHLEKCRDNSKVITYCLKNANKMLSLRNSQDALKNLEKALSMFNPNDFSKEKIQLLIKIGDLYSDDVNISNALKYYKEAEQISSKSNNTRLQIDSLNKLSSTYVLKYDMNEAEKCIEKCESLLMNFNYVRGYLECYRIVISVYIAKAKFNEAIELCKKCIPLCGDKFIKIKGYLYNSYGTSNLNINKIESALNCYSEAIKYFEKINFQNGIAICLNNIGIIYGDYYQDNRRAIDYFTKMKERCERYNILTLEVIALMNLGESYFYDLKYDLAYEYFQKSLEKAKKSESERDTLYCYNLLSSICLKLNNYKEAYNYHRLSSQEIKLYPLYGKDLLMHKQIYAELLYSFGQIEKAYFTIKEALETNSDDVSKQRFDGESLECLINLSRGVDDLKSLKKMLDNYSNNLDKTNVIFDACIIYCMNNNRSHVINLLKSYSDYADIDETQRIKLKYLFIEGFITTDNLKKIEFLNSALELSKNLNSYEMHWKICTILGDYYFEKENFFYAVNYYFEACEIIKKLTLQLPDKYKIGFLRSNGMLKPFNNLILLNKFHDYSKVTQVVSPDYIKINFNKDLDKLFSYKDFKGILNNKFFIESAQKIYNASFHKQINNVQDLINNLYSEPKKDLDLIAKYISSISLATRSVIILNQYNQKSKVIASSNGKFDFPNNNFVFETVKASSKPFLLNETTNKQTKVNDYYDDIKVAMCLPIFSGSDEESYQSDTERRDFNGKSKNIIGYMYLESDRILNNFNEITLKKCFELCNLTALVLDNYKLKISSSTDKLTGTLTRKFLEDALIDNIQKSSTLNETFSIIMFDLDHFKDINDIFGHQTGDEVLQKVCNIVLNNLRSTDLVGRYGGEEFIVILPRTNINKALLVGEKLKNSIDEAKILGERIPVTISMGIAAYPEHAQWKQDLIEKADQALYVAKENGRNKCQLWNSNFSSKAKVTNKLSGIIYGNAVSDYRNVLVISELINLISKKMPVEDKIYNILGRIIEITESQYGMLFVTKDNNVIKNYSRKIFEKDWVETKFYNINIINSVIEKQQGIYMIDWDEFGDYDALTGTCDWHSIIAVPLINSGVCKGVLYLSVSTKIKEFNFDNYNFVNTLGEIIAAII
ncbi:MAG: hypothetical protein K0R54_1705 [Clostridiaceae bacterium]|nr:hypothetical protein [Clostridiaceae bacterium]